MIGALTGDIIGSIYERDNIKTTEFQLFKSICHFTDDSVLTIALADSILSDVPYEKKLREYYHKYPHAGYGGHFNAWAFGKHLGPYNSYGNGAGMRISPVGWAYDSLNKVLQHAEINTAVTHNHPEGIKGGQATASAIFLARSGQSKEEIRNYISTHFGYNLSRSCDEIRPKYSFDVTCQGTIPQAVTAFLDSTDFESAVRLAVSLGGDTDTLACITGGIAEAFYGGVPEFIKCQTMTFLDGQLSEITEKFAERYMVGAK